MPISETEKSKRVQDALRVIEKQRIILTVEQQRYAQRAARRERKQTMGTMPIGEILALERAVRDFASP